MELVFLMALKKVVKKRDTENLVMEGSVLNMIIIIKVLGFTV